MELHMSDPAKSLPTSLYKGRRESFPPLSKRGKGGFLCLGFMKMALACAVFAVFLVSCEKTPSSQQEKTEPSLSSKIIVEKEKTEKEPPPPEVKIRLKRDGKETYSWELSGSDVDQILKVDEKLKRQMGGEPSR
jgi:hypothetical protein